jgi:hypothetical protein
MTQFPWARNAEEFFLHGPWSAAAFPREPEAASGLAVKRFHRGWRALGTGGSSDE